MPDTNQTATENASEILLMRKPTRPRKPHRRSTRLRTCTTAIAFPFLAVRP